MYTTLDRLVQTPEHFIVFVGQFVRTPTGIGWKLQLEQPPLGGPDRRIHPVVAISLSPEILYVDHLVTMLLQSFDCSLERLEVALLRQPNGESDNIVDPVEKARNTLLGHSLGKVLPPK